MTDKSNTDSQWKALVLARLGTLNSNAKILLGRDGEVSVHDLIQHVKKDDDFGKRIIQAQIKMIQVLAESA